MEMKAALFRSTEEPLSLEGVELAEPGASEVRVKVRAAGVCHSDYRVLTGDWSAEPPVVLGHEGAGVVESVGSHVTSLVPGDNVVLSWTPSCGVCRFCVSGRPQLCQVAAATAYRNVLPDGGTRIRSGAGEAVHSYLSVGSFAEYAVVPAHGAIKINGDVDPGVAALVGCAVTTGVGAAINTHPSKPGDSVLVLGAGGVGLSVVMGAALQSPGQLIVVDIAEEKLALARELGATHTINAKNRGVVEAVLDLTGGHGVEVAYEAIGHAASVEQAYESLAPGGTAVVVGQAASGERISIDPMRMSGRELTLTGSNYGSARPSIDFQRILDMHARGLLPLHRLIDERVGLADLNEAFSAMGAHTSSGRVVVDIP